MPAIPSMELPLPKNWQDFETLTRDALINKWNSPDLQKNGRGGQKQKGVDIYGHDYLGRLVGVQCKKYQGPLKMKTVEEEICNAAGFQGKLSTLWIATTAEHDSVLQQRVRLLSEARSKQGDFAVGILFWDEIIAGLTLNPASVTAHYPNVVLQPSGRADIDRQIAALELGYFGADIWAYVQLIYGDVSLIVETDPEELDARLRILEHRANQLFTQEEALRIVTPVETTRRGCTSPKQTEADWDPVEIAAKQASTRIAAASSVLTLQESNVLNLGLQLGGIYHGHDDVPNAEIQERVRTKLLSILKDVKRSSVDNALITANNTKFGFRWAVRVYSFISHTLRYQNLSAE
jgi:hypothetical protein